MTTPEKKRGWRDISVDTTQYLWVAKYWGYPPSIFVEVLMPDQNGQRLCGTFDEDRVVTPGVVEFLIKSAIKFGWTPGEPNHAVFKVDGDALVKGSEFELDHPRGSKGPW